MPNTLVHLGLQGAVSRAAVRDLDIKWIFLGCVLPDIPWIIKRILAWAAPDREVDLMLYAGAQASLAGCLLLAGGFSCLARRPRLVFAVLAGNALLHLLLDAVEIKPGKGVHLFAPLSWRMTNFDLLRPDDPRILALAFLGLGIAIWMLWRKRGLPGALDLSPARVVAAAALVALYLSAPFPFLDELESRDPYFAHTLHDKADRVGKEIALDRVAFLCEERGCVVVAPGAEKLRVLNPRLSESGFVTLRGTFVAPDAIAVRDIYAVAARVRDGCNYLGLALVAGLWAYSLVAPGASTRRKSC